MRKQLPDWKLPDCFKWHLWFAWFPVEAHETLYYDSHIFPRNTTYRVWLERVRRRRVVIDISIEGYWQYELQPRKTEE